mmetsp:Transcript_5023/g.11915  ORF Transcript_5023/g.11915 Transcript_5023/m.11915 type:complete len:214 (-) Transcript_5023:513-1154(-)
MWTRSLSVGWTMLSSSPSLLARRRWRMRTSHQTPRRLGSWTKRGAAFSLGQPWAVHLSRRPWTTWTSCSRARRLHPSSSRTRSSTCQGVFLLSTSASKGRTMRSSPPAQRATIAFRLPPLTSSRESATWLWRAVQRRPSPVQASPGLSAARRCPRATMSRRELRGLGTRHGTASSWARGPASCALNPWSMPKSGEPQSTPSILEAPTRQTPTT